MLNFICCLKIIKVLLLNVLPKNQSLLNLNLKPMPRMIYDYTKSELESVSIDPNLFKRKLKKAVNSLLLYEIDQLQNWLMYFTINKPDLQQCLTEIKNEKSKKRFA